MADIGTKFIEAVAEEITKGILAKIKRQLNYLCCFSSSIQSLRDEAQKMEDTRAGLLMQVSEAENNAQEIFPAVRTWLSDTNNNQVEMAEIESYVRRFQSGCLTNISSYSISKRAKEMAEAMMELRKSREQLDPISHPAPPPSTVPVLLGQMHEFQSRKQMEEDIIKALQLTEVTVVGIAGIGGVGKTTMAEKIMHRMMTEKLVDEAVKVVVSQQVDMLKIQLEIAELLGFKELKNWETLQARAHQLLARLTGSRRILIVLDDVWEKLKLENLGIPCNRGFSGCIVLMTSRNLDILKQMNAQVFAMQILPKQEAWSLFKDTVGNCVNDPNLVFVAEEVAEECKGLPIAITTVGGALKDQEKGIWEDALDQLKSANPTNMPEVLEEVYNPLYLSYTFLKNENAKSLFLLCCLFPEDFDIDVEDLTLYGMGLNKFGGVGTLNQARNRALTAVALLKNRSLLLEGKEKHHVRMHDVIRDVAIFIASGKGLVDSEFRSRKHSTTNCEWITEFPTSNDQSLDHLMGSYFPSLRLLSIQKKVELWKALEVNGSYFIEGMKELQVLSLENISFELPDRIGLLKNLCILKLVECKLRTISIVGELSSLEILICYRCRNIEELPLEIGRLRFLKLLNLSSCHRLKRVAPRVISNLVELEELKMLDSFKGWEWAKVDEKERENASLKELESLTKLSCLEIEVGNANLANEEICLSPTITKYKMLIGSDEQSASIYDNVLVLDGRPRDGHVGGWIQTLGRTAQELSLNGDGWRNFEISQAMNSIKSLDIRNCRILEELVNTSKLSGSTVFPALERLELYNLPDLKEICSGPVLDGSISFQSLRELSLASLPSLTHVWKSLNPNASLHNLSKITIGGCHKLRNVFLLERVGDVLFQLELIDISNCEMMEQVFQSEEDEKGSLITFPKLKLMNLYNLPSIETFGKGIESIEFPLLKILLIDGCPNLKSIVSPNVGTNPICTDGERDDVESYHLFCNKKVKFDGLEELSISRYNNVRNLWCKQIPQLFFKRLKFLYIDGCNSIRSSFSSLVANNLVNLKELAIKKCKNLQKVISDEENIPENSLLFPTLERLHFEYLPRLGMFYKWKCVLELPLLKEIIIVKCPQMEFLTHVSPSTPNLKRIRVDDKVIEGEALDETKDLNGLIRQHTVPARMESASEEDEGFHRDKKLVKIVKEDQEIVYLDTDGSINLDLSHNQNNIKVLKIRHCEMLEQLVIVSTMPVDWSWGVGVFPVLEYLTLDDLPQLKEICDVPIPEGSNSFKNLRKLSFSSLPSLTHLWMSPNKNISLVNNLCEIRISFCQLRNLFPLEWANDVVLQLKILEIWWCWEMTQIFPIEGDEEKHAKTIHIKFPELKTMKLDWLSGLKYFGKGIESIEFPMLKELTIRYCPMLVSFACPMQSKWRPGDGHNDNYESLHLFCNKKVHFGGLKTLSIGGYDNISNIWCRQIPMCFFKSLEELDISNFNDITSLFLPSIAENLISLKVLSIDGCKHMEIAIACGNEVHQSSKLFQRLERLHLTSLPLLGIFGEWRCAVELPSLIKAYIYGCPRLESLTLGSLIAPKLEVLAVESKIFEMEELENFEDLNDILRQHFKEKYFNK